MKTCQRCGAAIEWDDVFGDLRWHASEGGFLCRDQEDRWVFIDGRHVAHKPLVDLDEVRLELLAMERELLS